MNGRTWRFGLALLNIALTALVIATINQAEPISLALISLFALIGLAVFIVPSPR